MRLAVIALVIIVMASAIAMAFNYAHQPSYAAPSHAKRNQDANGNPVVRGVKAHRFSTKRQDFKTRKREATGKARAILN